jgi:hypothetical protein
VLDEFPYVVEADPQPGLLTNNKRLDPRCRANSARPGPPSRSAGSSGHHHRPGSAEIRPHLRFR